MLPILLGGKFVIMLMVMGFAGLASTATDEFRFKLAVLGIGIILGILGPEWILGMIRRRYTISIERGTPRRS